MCVFSKKRRHTAHPHQALRNAQPTMRAHDAQTRDMPMRHAVGGFLLHLREDVAHHFRIMAVPATTAAIPRFLLFGGGGGVSDDGDEAELRPRKRVVQVVFEEVVLGQVCDVAGLDGGEEREVGGVGGQGHDVDHFGPSFSPSFFLSAVFCVLEMGGVKA